MLAARAATTATLIALGTSFSVPSYADTSHDFCRYSGFFGSQAVTWLLVIVGWYVVDKRNNDRELRKETRAVLVECCKLLDEYDKAVTAYWAPYEDECTSQYKDLGVMLRAQSAALAGLERLSQDLQHECEYLFWTHAVEVATTNIAPSGQSRPARAQIAGKVSGTIDQLKSTLHRKFRDKF